MQAPDATAAAQASASAELARAVAFVPSAVAPAGSAAAFLLRTIAARAGCYAPGIQERLFFELTRPRSGASIDGVSAWLGTRLSELSYLGYRVLARRGAVPTPELLDWVGAGRGFRGALLATDTQRLHPDSQHRGAGAVGLWWGSHEDEGEALRVSDALLGVAPAPPPATLEAAHRMQKYAVLCLFWAGYS